jgi:hypothetical protein
MKVGVGVFLLKLEFWYCMEFNGASLWCIAIWVDVGPEHLLHWQEFPEVYVSRNHTSVFVISCLAITYLEDPRIFFAPVVETGPVTSTYILGKINLFVRQPLRPCPHFYLAAPSRLVQRLMFLTCLATDPVVPDSIPGATRFSEKWWVWNGVHSASWIQLNS